MACGLPVIASVEAGASENIEDQETGLLLRDPQDVRELAGLLERLFSDRPFGQKLGAAAAAYVQENCSWEQNARRTRDFLDATLLKHREP